MSQNPPPPKGRAAILMKLLAQAKERKPGVDPQASEPVTEEAPKPKGRAALVKKIAELRAAQKVGGEGPSTSSVKTTEAQVEAVRQKVEETTLAEPCSYKGMFVWYFCSTYKLLEYESYGFRSESFEPFEQFY